MQKFLHTTITKYIFSALLLVVFTVPASVFALNRVNVSYVGTIRATDSSIEVSIDVRNDDSFSSEVWFSCNLVGSAHNNTLYSNHISVTGSQKVSVTVSNLSPGKYYCAPQAMSSEGDLFSGYSNIFRLGAESSESLNYGNSSASINSATAAAVATTWSATDVAGNSAVLNGKVDGKGGSQYWFEWGTTNALGNSTAKIGITYQENVSTYIDGLQPETLYYFRVTAQNKYGVKRGSTFVLRTGKNTAVGQGNTAGGGTTDTNGGSYTDSQIQTVVEVRNNTTIIDGVIPAGKPVIAWFEYGKTNRLGSKTEEQTFDGKKEYLFSDTLYNLDKDTVYYAQPVYDVDGEIVRGDIVSFSTSPNAKREQIAGGTDSGTENNGLLGALFGGAAANGSDSGAAAGGLLGLLNRKKADANTGAAAIDTNAVKNDLSSKMKEGISESDEYGWGKYLQRQYFSMNRNAAVFGLATTAFIPYASQRASVVTASDGSILPNSFFEWMLLIVILFVVITIARRVYIAFEERKKNLAKARKEKLEEAPGPAYYNSEDAAAAV